MMIVGQGDKLSVATMYNSSNGDDLIIFHV
jgi:hypothetical protein